MKITADQEEKDYLRELFKFHELFAFFALRDILVRYRQAFFGIAWAVIRPVLTMGVFALIFGQLARFSSDGVYYPLFVLAGMIPWQFFSNSIQDGCHCLINNSHLVTKSYFPRMIIPASQLMIHLVDGLVNLVFLAAMLLFTQTPVSYTLIFLPLFLGLLLILCLGVSLWVSSLTIHYRDFRILIPFCLQFGMFVSPVGYGTFMIPSPYQYLYFLNPIVGIIDGIRWSLFGTAHPYLFLSIFYSIALSLGCLVTGFYYFRKMERTFADKL